MRKQRLPSNDPDKFVLNSFLEKENPTTNEIVAAIKAIIRVIALIIMGKDWKE